MHSRRDKIMKNCEIASKIYIVTDIDKIFERWCDFSEHKDIYYSQNQYSSNYRVAAQSYSLQPIEFMLDKNDEKSKNDPMYRLPKMPLPTSKKRQLVNVGLDEEEANFKILNQDDLYCNEELPPSVNQETDDIAYESYLCRNGELSLLVDLKKNVSKVPIDPCNNIPSPFLDQHLSQVNNQSDIPESIDPYANSDDDNNKDYDPEKDLNCSASSDETICLEDKQETEIRVLKPVQVQNPHQHCEFLQCFSKASNSCVNCSCLLCLDHFDTQQFNTCDKHQPYTATDHDTSFIEKENNKKYINLSPINNYDNKNEKEYTDSCEYKNCKEEIFSACGKCLCYLCYEHFISETTYNDCKNHTLIQKIGRKTNQTQNKAKKNILTTGNKKIDEDIPLNNKITTLAEKDTTQMNEMNGDTTLIDKDITHTDRDISQTDIDILQTHIDTLQTDTTKAHSNKGWTKKGNPRKRRKLEESITERKNIKIKAETEKLTVKNPCTDTCKKKCTENFCEEDRTEINNEYISLSWESKGHYIKSLVTAKEVKCRKVTNAENPKRTINYIYTFYKDKTQVEVCKTFFLTTLGYNAKNDKRLMLALKRPIDKQNDRRGQYDRIIKCDRELIKGHVMRYNPVISHYRREHAPNRLYLPSDITITLMHQDFCGSYPQEVASFEVYRKVVRDEMNISFAHLGNEECEVCAEYKEHHESHAATDKDCDFCQLYRLHKDKYKAARKAYKTDVSESENSTNTIYYSADLQKVVMLPRMDQFKRAIFCPRIIAFNESFVPLGNSKKGNNIPFAAVWNESVSGRKKEDIISTINAFLLHKRDAEQIVIWMDNCCAQNKNWALFSFLVYIINSQHINAIKITLKYFEPGHTFMSADSFHHQVEQAMQRKQKVYDFSDFVDSVQQANSKKCLVKSMEVGDFFNYTDLSSQHKLRRSEPRVYLKNIMVIVANRGEYQLRYQLNHNAEEEQCLEFLQTKIFKHQMFPEYKEKVSPRGVPKSTKDEIINKLLTLMPNNRKGFWLNLPVSEHVTNIE